MLGILALPEHVAALASDSGQSKQNTIDASDENSDEGSTIGSFHEPPNFKFAQLASPPQRRVTIADDLPTCKTNPDYKPRCRTRYSTFIAGLHQFDPYQELTATQIAAFRQVFDMVDRDGGGSIDADELYLSMKDLESGLKLDEIKEILDELDRDGNGEIDFEEFLYMMTSMSLQIRGTTTSTFVLLKLMHIKILF